MTAPRLRASAIGMISSPRVLLGKMLTARNNASDEVNLRAKAAVGDYEI
jgi:hypothetical protein